MIKKFFCSKLFVLFTSLLIVGFFIGYDYSLITSRDSTRTTSVKAPVRIDNRPAVERTESTEEKDTEKGDV